MDSHQHATEKLQELYQQAEIARALRHKRPQWLRQAARYLIQLARQMDHEIVVLQT